MYRGKIIAVGGECVSTDGSSEDGLMTPNEEAQDTPRHRSIYLLPNLLTTAALFSGFYAIVAAMKGNFEQAAVAIFIAMIMDTLDGRVARLTKTQSAFGAQYDSLSDMVSFGLTPALVVYRWALEPLGKIGWIASFIYAAATALRLARFNIQTATDKRYFLGLPCPAAAAVLAGLVWLDTEYPGTLNLGQHFLKLVIALLTLTLGLLMVSNIRYYSFKEVDFKGHVPFVVVLVGVLLMGVIAYEPPLILFLGFMLYALTGPVMWCRSWIKKG